MTTTETRFVVERWWADKPEFVIDSLLRQLKAAQAIWPEIREYGVGKRKATPAHMPDTDDGTAGNNR